MYYLSTIFTNMTSDRAYDIQTISVIRYANTLDTFNDEREAKRRVILNSMVIEYTVDSALQVLVNMNVLYSYVVEKSSTQNIFANGIAEALVTLSG